MTKKRLILLVIAIIVCVIALVCAALFGVSIAHSNARIKEKARAQERDAKLFYQNRLVTYEVENVITDDYQIDVAFVGDRVIAKYDVMEQYEQYKVLNRAIDGESAEQLEQRMKVSLYDLKPKVIVLLLSDVDHDTIIENYDSILDGIHKNLPNTKVVLLSLPPLGDKYSADNADICLTNVKIELLAKKYNYEYLDIHSTLFDLYENEIFGAYTYDGKLLTPSGYYRIDLMLHPLLKSLLNEWTMP